MASDCWWPSHTAICGLDPRACEGATYLLLSRPKGRSCFNPRAREGSTIKNNTYPPSMPGPETPHAQGKVGLGAKKGAGALAGREGGGFRKPAGGSP